MSPNASHRVRPGLSSAASLITTLPISFDQEVLNQHLNLVTPEYPFFESPWEPPGWPLTTLMPRAHSREESPVGRSPSLLPDVGRCRSARCGCGRVRPRSG